MIKKNKKIDANKIREMQKKDNNRKRKISNNNIKNSNLNIQIRGMKKKEKSTVIGFLSKRLSWIVIGVCCVFSALSIRLGYVMIVKGSEYKDMSEKQWRKELEVPARRGEIFDRNGLQLARTSQVYRADLDLEAIKSYCETEDVKEEDVISKVAEILSVSYEEVDEIFNSKFEDGTQMRFVILARRIEKSVADALEATNIYGINISQDTKRYYPNDNFLAHVLGSTGSDGTPLSGIELYYDDVLSGKNGTKIAGLDGVGRELPYVQSSITNPINGSDISLTIDENIQYFAETIAQKGVEEHKAKRVSILVMNPNNGEILAMVNKPDFNPNNPYDGFEIFEGDTEAEKIQAMWRNNIVSDAQEPGSTFKNVTMLAALEEGLVNEWTTFECSGGVHFGDSYVQCWQTWGHGTQNLPEILMNSCNVGFMKLGEMLGKETLNKYIKKYGFGELTGIDLLGEAVGIVKDTEDIADIDLATISFGQTNTVTVLQLMQSFNAIANDGQLITPHILKEISHYDENGVKIIDHVYKPKIVENILSPENALTLRGYLQRTITQDEDPDKFLVGHSVGGKTGTGQKVDIEYGGYSADKYLASVVALAPVENPQITVYVAVDEPSTGVYYGGQTAKPLLQELLKEIFLYTDSINGYFNQDSNYVTIPEIRGMTIETAKEKLKSLGLDVSINGNGQTVNEILPVPGTVVTKGEKVQVDTSIVDFSAKLVRMPDLQGKSLEEATEILSELEIMVTYEGYGIVKDQSIPKNTLVKKNTEVLLTLEPKEL